VPSDRRAVWVLDLQPAAGPAGLIRPLRHDTHLETTSNIQRRSTGAAGLATPSCTRSICWSWTMRICGHGRSASARRSWGGSWRGRRPGAARLSVPVRAVAGLDQGEESGTRRWRGIGRGRGDGGPPNAGSWLVGEALRIVCDDAPQRLSRATQGAALHIRLPWSPARLCVSRGA
jgi:hypothetical protein